MALPIWRQNLRPASFNGVPFKVELDGKSSGRRIVPHEFPKKNRPWAEDMGRRIRRFVVNAYIVYSPELNPDYQAGRDALIEQLEAEGPGMLVLPTGLEVMSDGASGLVAVDTYTVTERRERGGYCEFEIAFFEAGETIQTAAAGDTQSAVKQAARAAILAFGQSTDVAALVPVQ
jgi:prophage DNA circulation protein